MGWAWALLGGNPRDEHELRIRRWATVGPLAFFATAGLVILAGSLLTGARWPWWHPFTGSFLLLLGAARAMLAWWTWRHYERTEMVDANEA